MAKKPKTKKIDDLLAEQQAVATAFHLIGGSSFPATQAQAVLSALKYLDDKHSEVAAEIGKLTPVEAPVEAPAFDPS